MLSVNFILITIQNIKLKYLIGLNKKAIKILLEYIFSHTFLYIFVKSTVSIVYFEILISYYRLKIDVVKHYKDVAFTFFSKYTLNINYYQVSLIL